MKNLFFLLAVLLPWLSFAQREIDNNWKTNVTPVYKQALPY